MQALLLTNPPSGIWRRADLGLKLGTPTLLAVRLGANDLIP